MRSRSRILAGTALGLLMAAQPLAANADDRGRRDVPVVAQAEGTPSQEELLQQQGAPEEEQPPAEQAPAEAPAEPEQAPAEEPQPSAEPEQAPTEQAPAEAPEAPAEAPQAPAEAPAEPERAPAEQQAPAEQAPATEPQAPAEAPQPPAEPEQAPAEQAPDEPAQAPTETAPDDQAAPAEAPAAPEGQAPVLDSQKQPAPGSTEGAAEPAAPKAGPEGQPGEPAQPAQAAPAAPSTPPVDDGSAQQLVAPAEIQPVTAEQGRRFEVRPEQVVRERPRQAEVLREVGDRTIVQVGDQVIVQSNERPRLSREARDVYYEELPRGRTRETIVRTDGTRVVTIRDRYGDVIRRSRIASDDREYVLVYVDEDDYDRVGEWRDPGLDLPPLQLAIPDEEYILDSQGVNDPDDYYAFLEQPPVEQVERLYSIDEVKRSARIRDKTRRVDLDTITFEFGSASIDDSEVRRLEGVAAAMEKSSRRIQRRPSSSRATPTPWAPTSPTWRCRTVAPRPWRKRSPASSPSRPRT